MTLENSKDSSPGARRNPDTSVDHGELEETNDETAQPLHRQQPCTRNWKLNRAVSSCRQRYRCPCPGSTRLHITLLISIGFCISFGIRCNMGVAILQITTKPGFDWGVWTIQLVDLVFFVSYLVAQIPGGILAYRLPANLIFGGAIAISAFLNLFLPGAFKVHYSLVMFLRILQGLAEGVTLPACFGLFRYWAPPLERTKLATISFCGMYAGVLIGMPFSRFMGWAACFYVYGILGLLWFVIWWFYSSPSPATHYSIPEEEKNYIENSICESNSPYTASSMATSPWEGLFTSTPVCAIIVASFCQSWSFFLMKIYQSRYFEEVFNFKVYESGTLSALPHLVMTIIVPIGGCIADLLRRRKILSTTSVRKIFSCGSSGLVAIFLFGVGFTETTFTAIVLLTMAVGFSGLAISGFNVNHLDIAPRYASIVMGMSNGVGILAGIICPIVTEKLTRHGTFYQWRTVFIIAGVIHVVGVIFYAIFADGEKQPWADPLEEEDAKPNTTSGSLEVELNKERDINEQPQATEMSLR